MKLWTQTMLLLKCVTVKTGYFGLEHVLLLAYTAHIVIFNKTILKNTHC